MCKATCNKPDKSYGNPVDIYATGEWMRRGFDRKGYRVISHKKTGKKRMEHRVIYEAHHGKIPPGMDVHHINENKSDNRIENLVLMSSSEHVAMHNLSISPPEAVTRNRKLIEKNGTLYKVCARCLEEKPVSEYYKTTRKRRDKHHHYCKECDRARCKEYRDRKKAEKLAA